MIGAVMEQICHYIQVKPVSYTHLLSSPLCPPLSRLRRSRSISLMQRALLPPLLSVILFFSYSGSFQFTVKSVILYKWIFQLLTPLRLRISKFYPFIPCNFCIFYKNMHLCQNINILLQNYHHKATATTLKKTLNFTAWYITVGRASHAPRGMDRELPFTANPNWNSR